jgi:cell shape-determining protein MreC
MERFYKKSTADFYTLIFLLLLSISTIILDYKYNQITYIRFVINDLIIYPINKVSSLPKTFINELITESSDIKNYIFKNKVTGIKFIEK